MFRKFQAWLIVGWAVGLCGCGPEPVAERPAAPVPEAQATSAPSMAPKVAEVGVGASTQNLENQGAIGQAISTPATAFFRTKERIVFEIQIPKVMGLFQALEGRLPKSHDEFMQKIIKENQISLPKLPDGQVYLYHPDDGQLWVEPK